MAALFIQVRIIYRVPRHAEEGVIAEFENAVNNAGIRSEDVKGDLYLMQSNGNEVCNKCTKGLLSPSQNGGKGIFKQFIELYPNLNIHIYPHIVKQYLELVMGHFRLIYRMVL